MDYLIAKRVAAEAARRIFADLADRRGIPDDLLHGDGWSGAREVAEAVIIRALMAPDVRTKGDCE